MVQVVKNPELDNLAGQADRLDQDQDGPGQGDQAGPAGPLPMGNAQALTMAFELIRDTVCTVARVKSPRQVLTGPAMAPLADAWAAVLDKHGVSLSSMVGDYLVEFRAIGLTVPLLLAAREAIREELAARNAKPIEPESSTVTNGAGPDGAAEG